jgi:DNA-binding GntR family transcriptional regulator
MASKRNYKLGSVPRPSSRLADQTYQIIRESILSARIRPGERLAQEALASELGVSQITVREALFRLVSEGLAVSEPYRGVLASKITPEDVEDIYEMRALLEGRAVELAAERITDEELGRMRELLPSTAMHSAGYSIEAAREANREFHWIAIRACRRKHLIRVLSSIWELIDPRIIYNPSPLQDEPPRDSAADAHHNLVEHGQLLGALEARNGTLARQLATEAVFDALEGILDKGRQGADVEDKRNENSDLR